MRSQKVICVSISKSQVICQEAKNVSFCQFFMLLRNKFQVAANRTMLKFDALPIAHFEGYVPNFSKHMFKIAISFFWPISTQWTPPSVIHGWKANDLLFNMVKRKTYFSNPRGCQNFGNTLAEDWWLAEEWWLVKESWCDMVCLPGPKKPSK